MAWKITASGTKYTIKNVTNNRYLESTSVENGSFTTNTLSLTDTAAEWTYSSGIFTSETSDKELKYDDDAFDNDASILFTIRSDGSEVKLYLIHDTGAPDDTVKPDFENASFTMASSTATTAEFTLINTYTDQTTFRVYANNTDTAEAAGVTTSLTGASTLTLTFDSAPTADVTYYISATHKGLGESARTEVTVLAYVETFTYTKVNTIADGKSYLIVTEASSRYLAMNTTISTSGYGYLKTDEVTDNLSGDTITWQADDAAAVEWVLTGSDSSFTMYNSAEAEYAALYINPDHADYTYG
jgi:hypothetical protein